MAGRGKKKRRTQPWEFIRLALKGDSLFIRNLSGEVFSAFGDYGEIIGRWLVNPTVITVMYVRNGDPLGFAMLHVLSGELLAIAVLPTHQSKGIGSALLTYVQFLASQLGLRRLLLHTGTENTVARSFFQKAGFEAMGVQEGYYPEGQSAIAFSKRI